VFLLNDEVAISEILEIKNGKTVVTSADSDKYCEVNCSESDSELMNSSRDPKTVWAQTTTVASIAGVAEKAGGGDSTHTKVISITAKWTNDLSENTLSGVSIDVRPGGFVAVIGPVGSGKVNYKCFLKTPSYTTYVQVF
jgi:ABC-type glutathione transport system ATPase component